MSAPSLTLVALLLAGSLSLAESVTASSRPAQVPVAPDGAGANPVVVIQAYADGLAGGCAAKPGVRLRIGRDRSIPDERVLLVDYPVPTDDPAGRDVQCAATNHDWSAGHAISFHAKPSQSVRLSVSFLDRNRVAYTAWTELKGGVWQLVRIPFDEIRPNPFFQPPDAKTSTALDVSDVNGIAFAPQGRTSGRLSIGRFVVSQ